ncbi:MAG: NADH-quinone oxidoreductase subunit H, partial [Candidatus Rokubacteria bacterium]|nr:NADH-quinone oxidoreductase subunit H [Candidatus Rokubacteria bacterium]
MIASVFHILLLLLAPPLMLGIVTRTKALFAGRRGPPLLQAYFDLWKLLRKGAVYSRTTTWVFRAGPIVGLAAVIASGLLVPIAGIRAPMAFQGDLILFAYLLGLARFFTVLAAMDTGSSFEGMGASREATFGSLAEPALFAGFLVLVVGSGDFSLSGILGPGLLRLWSGIGPALVLVAVSFAVLLLAENCRIPVDDPNTHLELTMIHEVMVLDHGGPDLAYILHGAAMKLFLFASILVRLVLPTDTGFAPLEALVWTAGMGLVAIMVGCVESAMARL